MVQKSDEKTTWDVWNPVNDEINYQPQVVQDIFHQQYHSKMVWDGVSVSFIFVVTFTTRLEPAISKKKKLSKCSYS